MIDWPDRAVLKKHFELDAKQFTLLSLFDEL